MNTRFRNAATVVAVAITLSLGLAAADVAAQKKPDATTCPDKNEPTRNTLRPGTGKDLEVTGVCKVPAGTYNYGDVNIFAGGSLQFDDAAIDFWASSILIENRGALIAGNPSAPIGTQNGQLTIHLYGKDQGTGVGTAGGQGIVCEMDVRCGIPQAVWDSDGTTLVPIPGMPDDYFYTYGSLPFDGGGATPGFFGYKVLAVSYGGTLQLFGKKGATYGNVDSSNSGTSWVRLDRTLPIGKNEVVLDRPVDWAIGDEIVVTTTDYLPAHSEQFTIIGIKGDSKTLTVDRNAAHEHQGRKYDLSGVGIKLSFKEAETRAAVGLLSRSIRIVSEGDAFDTPLPADSFFGGHTIVRQGFAKFQVQGVEFRQLGQGGRLGHYPVHFHMVRAAPPDTFVKDSTVNESMTRFMTLHATQNVTLARNVGWKSIGHGFYIEDGTEYDNRFLTNLGVFARAAIVNKDNPRKVPGILAAARDPGYPENVPFYSDYDHPAVFWIMNGWNDFEYNMAAGAGTCGICYWLVPGANSGHSRNMKWKSYASMQANPPTGNPLAKAATTPLKRFVGNGCSSAMNAFNTIGNTTACWGVGTGAQATVAVVANPLAPPWCDQTNPRDKDGKYLPNACIVHMHGDDGGKYAVNADEYYPKVDKGGGRFATRCGPNEDCSNVPRCDGGQLDRCMVTALEGFTTSFNWAETNFSAIWLRPQWYLVTDSVITDVQNGGLTIVTGGGYTDSDLVKGHWALLRNSALIGSTQPGNPYASDVGPFNPGGLKCDNAAPGNYCLDADEGVSFLISNFGTYQRFFNIYDGPAYQENNAYLNIRKTILDDCQPGGTECRSSRYLVAQILGVPQADGKCYAPNAAIGWKQPNGFYYPPAFHSHNLYFSDVDIRHFVIEPLFITDPAKKGNQNYKTDAAAVLKAYCTSASNMFDNFTDVDRQTELTDDDGSLTGYVKTVSVNSDPFFNAPVEQTECESDETAKTSPYDYVTSVVYPGCAVNGTCGAKDGPPRWDSDCTNGQCYGVPLYRQLLTKSEQSTGVSSIRMAGQDTYQRSTLTPNNAVYYIDTTVSLQRQMLSSGNVNVFGAGQSYYTFMLFANAKTTQTYQMYVGAGFDPNQDVWATQADISQKRVHFSHLAAWPSGWGRSYDEKSGVLTVTMNMSFPEFAANLEKARAGTCGPATFCSSKGSVCSCALSPGDPLYAACSAKNSLGQDACSWSNKDTACPEGGCYGIGFKLAPSFKTDPQTDPRPAAACFPKEAAAGWNVNFVPASAPVAGSCYNAPIPPNQFCD
ncbi:MAG: G8 domain-containing protein [Burkholderiales bacterium]|nr:G8 domain-containing protein [Burkholderiales bacterium]